MRPSLKEQKSKSSLPTKRFGPKPSLTESQKQELKLAFGEFDPRGVGMIDSRNFLVSLRAMGFEPNSSEVNKFIKNVIGQSSKKQLDFKDYYQLMSLRMLEDEKKSEMVMMFKTLCDDDEAEVITLDHLKRVAAELEENISADELQEMISYANTSKTGNGVSLEEFIKMMERPQLE